MVVFQALFFLSLYSIRIYATAICLNNSGVFIAGMTTVLFVTRLAGTDRESAGVKSGVIEDICAAVIGEMKLQHLTDADSDYLEGHAFSVTEHIENAQIRALHVMEG